VGAIVQLRNQGEISNDTMCRIGRDLGLGDSGSRSRSDRFALVEGGTGGGGVAGGPVREDPRLKRGE
jgi:hypothetical protein